MTDDAKFLFDIMKKEIGRMPKRDEDFTEADIKMLDTLLNINADCVAAVINADPNRKRTAIVNPGGGISLHDTLH